MLFRRAIRVDDRFGVSNVLVMSFRDRFVNSGVFVLRRLLFGTLAFDEEESC